jgi:hypothetical protein
MHSSPVAHYPTEMQKAIERSSLPLALDHKREGKRTYEGNYRLRKSCHRPIAYMKACINLRVPDYERLPISSPSSEKLNKSADLALSPSFYGYGRESRKRVRQNMAEQQRRDESYAEVRKAYAAENSRDMERFKRTSKTIPLAYSKGATGLT